MIKILTIDDSNFTRIMIKKILKNMVADVEVFEAENGTKGFDVFQKEPPDLVLCDLLMPDIHGIEIIQKMRSERKDCFIAVVSSDIQQSTQDKVIEEGANMFLGKPFSKEKFSKMMELYEQFKRSI